jgi:HAD superfamily hydrolase (TIGR01484 family)
MRYLAFATDYDGTLAKEGQVDETTLKALERLRESGRKLILVTGRHLEDLLESFPQIELFDQVVVENGAVLYRPETREEKALAEPPSEAFVQALQARGVNPLAVGRVIVATWEPHETTVMEVIRDLGLELQVIFNKGAVMVLPSGLNKAAGLKVALKELGLSPHNTVGVGDAENDHAFMNLCECAVAVANALPALKERADWVTQGQRGAGVTELINRLIESDLAELNCQLKHHHILLGTDKQEQPIYLPPYGESVLLAGTSGSGKSTLATAILERLAEQDYQFCIIDPEGDYENFEGAVMIGDSHQEPNLSELFDVLDNSQHNAVVNLLGISLENRPTFFAGLLPRLLEMRARTGRPHWIVVDEAHHLLPSAWDPAALMLPQKMDGMILVTVHPDQVASPALALIDAVIAVGKTPEKTLASFSKTLEQNSPTLAPQTLEPGEAIAWFRHTSTDPFWFRIEPPSREHRRHRRLYAQGELGEDKCFYFRGPENQLNLRAHNLVFFMQLGNGVDEKTWLYHLHQGDYSQWFRHAIKDEELAAEAENIEQQSHISAQESRELIQSAIEKRYTLPA